MISRIMSKMRRGQGRKPADQRGDIMTDGGQYDVKVDHLNKIIKGNVILGRAGGCPHQLARRNDAGDIVAHEPCTGEAGHPSQRHADRFGRTWS